MTMSKEEVHSYVITYLEAMECQILEKSPAHVTVKLSIEADKALTNRPYYWGFVDRTGAPAETMSFTFIFDAEAHLQAEESAKKKAEAETAKASENAANEGKDSILGRYFGHTPSLPQIGPGRVLRENIVYGSSRLKQIFSASREGGAYVNLFEQSSKRQISASTPKSYEPWLGVCFKIEFSCDMRKEELHFLGVSLLTGRIVENFGQVLNKKELSPRLPENMHAQAAKIPLTTAGEMLEQHIYARLKLVDYSWADAAKQRLEEELAVVDIYYEDLLKEEQEEEKKQAVQDQYNTRRSEMIWQYEPKINVNTISCGIFHLK
ncbi:YqhG family protein [Paenibacillus provencensis]|uniref:YqhG family protein n=1 Tax=Paenibacillus provencensis TaxID=441151 RepID=A0ABW3PNW9_9BACL|nr:YqhG family protein [Paenibacillus sp. MER 78]MCM3130263.1 YqhG family protein [Paenibacillus sp. MER 78]